MYLSHKGFLVCSIVAAVVFHSVCLIVLIRYFWITWAVNYV